MADLQNTRALQAGSNNSGEDRPRMRAGKQSARRVCLSLHFGYRQPYQRLRQRPQVQLACGRASTTISKTKDAWRRRIRPDGTTDQLIARRWLDRDRIHLSRWRRNRSQSQWNISSRAWKINLAFRRSYLAGPAVDPTLIRLAQVPETCQKRGKVGSVKQRLLAELDAFEVTSFDSCVQRSAADAEQLKCLVDRVRYLRKTEGRRVDRIGSGALIVVRARHGLVRRNVVMGFARVSHGTHCVTRLGVNEQPKSALCYAIASFSGRELRMRSHIGGGFSAKTAENRIVSGDWQPVTRTERLSDNSMDQI